MFDRGQLGISREIKAVRNTLVSRACVSLDFAFRALIKRVDLDRRTMPG
jgi:hypothetical protein